VAVDDGKEGGYVLSEEKAGKEIASIWLRCFTSSGAGKLFTD
jgi:hypothetical protein